MPESVVDKQDDKDERPSADSNSMTKEHKEARQQDRKQKEKQKNYADKSKFGTGFWQTNTTVSAPPPPPYNPEAYVANIRGADITARRGKKIVTRDVQKLKKMERPHYLQRQGKGIGQLDSEEKNDWEWDLMLQNTIPEQQEMEEQAGLEEAQVQPNLSYRGVGCRTRWRNGR